MFSQSKMLLARSYKLSNSISRSYSSRIPKLGDAGRVEDDIKVIGRRFEKIFAGKRASNSDWLKPLLTPIEKIVSFPWLDNFDSFLTPIDKVTARYKGQIERLVAYGSAFSMFHQMLVALFGWIFGAITLKTISNKSEKIMEKVDKLDRKMDKFENELKIMLEKLDRIDEKLKKQSPASTKFRWPWA